jgi:3',5'-cyclic AMP phosphodiesterase CpdA
VLIAQITDTHIQHGGEQPRYLAEALDAIAALDPRPDVVLLSGDTVDRGLPEEYALLRDVLARCALPLYLVPGNHDRPDALRTVLPAVHFPGVTHERMHYMVEAFAVRLIGLDSARAMWPGGIFDAADLAWLDAALAGAPERPTLIFMHHPPFRTGVNAADLFGFRGLRRLHALLEQRPAVRRIIAGHIHCARSATLGNALATTGISTAPQRVPEVFEERIIAVRREPAGFTTHRWDGQRFTSTTHVNDGTGRFSEVPRLVEPVAAR